jgi:hypothetical protein
MIRSLASSEQSAANLQAGHNYSETAHLVFEVGMSVPVFFNELVDGIH